MKIVSTKNIVKKGKRTLVGSFEKRNGISKKNISTGSQVQTLKIMDFKSVTLVILAGEF
jgi:hypothetical protein